DDDTVVFVLASIGADSDAVVNRGDGSAAADGNSAVVAQAGITALGIVQNAVMAAQNGAVADLALAGAGSNDSAAGNAGAAAAHEHTHAAVGHNFAAGDVEL